MNERTDSPKRKTGYPASFSERELLKYSAKKNSARDSRKQESGENYNVFKTLDLLSDEVNFHCRFLHDLLSPNGAHGMGDVFLKLFFEQVLGVTSEKDLPFSKATVRREYACDDGRIDLLIEIPRICCVIIEVKIYATDQTLQLQRYGKFLDGWERSNPGYKMSKLCYLTLDGHEASERSTGVNKENDLEYKTISFEDDITRWLQACKDAAKGRPFVSSTIAQYITAIAELTGSRTIDDELKAVTNNIFSSESNYCAAAQIESALPLVRALMLIKIFDDIEGFICENYPQLIDLTTEYEKADIRRYYSSNGRKARPWPRLRFEITCEERKTLALTVEVDHRLYMGLTFFEKDPNVPYRFHLIDSDRQKFLNMYDTQAWKRDVCSKQPNGWWLNWQYLYGGRMSQINFKKCSEGYASLFDANQYEEWMDCIKQEIREYLRKIEESWGIELPSR